jgi:hypothetical protein
MSFFLIYDTYVSFMTQIKAKCAKMLLTLYTNVT